MQILCATDFSAVSLRAADVAATIAGKLGLPLRLIHSLSDWPLAAEMVPMEYQFDIWGEQLDAEVKRLRETGVEVSSELRRGAASVELIAAAAEQPTKLIVVGSTGRGMAERWLLGSVAERVAEAVPAPTLVVRDPDSLLAWLRNGNPLRVLCGVDFNLSSDAALVALKELDKWGHLEVEAVHLRAEKRGQLTTLLAGATQPEEDSPSADVELGRDVWDRVCHVLGQPPARAHVFRTTRHPHHEMARLAETREANLVVLGTHQRHGWQRLAAPSFSRSILAHASTNVMCVPVGTYVPAFESPIIRRVLVATNFSNAGHNDIRHAFALLAPGGEIQVLHVVSAPKPGANPLVRSMTYLESGIESEHAKTAAEIKLHELLRGLPEISNVQVTAKAIAHEHVSTGICEAADKFGADVICVGSANGLQGFLPGSVAHAVISRSTRPVLVVPPAPV